MSGSPLVSVIMCTYNGSDFIDEQVRSILKQDYRNFELIIVDDCSTDETYEKLKEWQRNSAILKLYKNEQNIGYNKNFEKAIQLGKGDFIALADQDDIWLSNKVTKLISGFTENEITLVHGRSVRLENGHLKYHKANLHYHFKGRDTRRFFFFNHIMGHDAMFRKELVSKIVPIPEGMSYDWWIAVIATCYGRIESVKEYLVHHRIHTSNNFFSKTADSKKKELDLEETLRLLSSIKELTTKSRIYLEHFIELLHEHNKKNKPHFDLKLFTFLYKNRKIIFGHKRRALPELSYFKNVIKYSRMNYNGKGISF